MVKCWSAACGRERFAAALVCSSRENLTADCAAPSITAEWSKLQRKWSRTPHASENRVSVALTVLFFCSCVEYRTFIMLFHLFLFKTSSFATFAALSNLLHFHSVVLFQVIIGLPLFLVPWGFHSNVCLSIASFGVRSVWSIEHHLVSFIICCWIGVYFVLRYNSSFEILSGDLTFSL